MKNIFTVQDMTKEVKRLGRIICCLRKRINALESSTTTTTTTAPTTTTTTTAAPSTTTTTTT